jgi:preprotein translocase subunit SecA
MLKIVNKAITKLFGSKSERDMKELLPYVKLVNDEWKKIAQSSVSDNDLRLKTQEIKGIISQRLQEIDEQILNLQQQAQALDLDLNQKEDLYNQVDKLEEDRNRQLEEVMLEVLPLGFAVVKETARRLKENGQLQVETTDFDRELAVNRPHVVIEGEKTTWKNRWMAAGNEIVWDMLHYDVQIIGGVVLHQGKVAEMATGEGKTLVATLPAYLNALAQRGVHVVTVNDYLARRDSEWMAPIFEFHQITIDCIDKHKPGSEARRKAYRSDIIYGTNNEFGFDYLRDNMAEEVDKLVQGKHHFAMIDEVDSVLIDEARTPLIISGPVPRGDEHEFQDLKPRISRVVDAQKKLIMGYLNESKKHVKEGNEKEAGLPLFRAHRGMPKFGPLIKFLGESGMRVLMQRTENYYLQDNAKMMPEADKPLYFTIDEKNNQIDLTERGIDAITGSGEDPTFFILPDIGLVVAQLEENTTLSEQEKLEKKETMINDYSVKASRIHSINQLLKAYTLFEIEVDYTIDGGEIKIVDEQTGRMMAGRRYSDGLHQALEAKENVRIQEATQTYATITLQNYFRMYHKISGMTGTAETEAGELWDIYKLDVVVIPTNVPIKRKDDNDLIYKTMREKYRAVIDSVEELVQAGRPVLVGTTSIDNSELLSRMLTMKKIEHQVLNAKRHQKEAEVVAEAGKPGTVTIATNMAGRGTDIKLTAESKSAGGLAILGTERHESRRVDRQLRGRAGRQGDPGSSQFFVSLEDNLMRLFGSERMAKIMDRMGLKEGEVIQHSMMTKSIERAQKKVEENNFGIRKRLLEYDDIMNQQREIIYARRKNALYGERLEFDIMNTIYDTCSDIVENYQGPGNYENFRLEVLTIFGIEAHISSSDFESADPNQLIGQLYQSAVQKYRKRNQSITEKALPFFNSVKKEKGSNVHEIRVPLTDNKKSMFIDVNLDKVIESEGRELVKTMEKSITLALIDQEWKEHLREMDDLKQSVQNAVYEQKDPLIIYKFEAFELFKGFMAKVNLSMVSFLMKADIPTQNPNDVRETRNQTRRRAQPLNEKKADAQSLVNALAGVSSGGGGGEEFEEEAYKEKAAPAKSQKIFGRNDKVTVKYPDGKVKKDVKYKTVETDLKNEKCVLIED